MNKYIPILCLLIVVCCCGASPCWNKHTQYITPAPVVGSSYFVYGYQNQYVPVVVQERVLVPMVENKVLYLPVVGQFYMNYGHYYVMPSYYRNDQYYPWLRYNY